MAGFQGGLRISEFFNVNAVCLFENPHNRRDRFLARFLGQDQKGRIQMDVFRIRPNLEAIRYGKNSAYKALTPKQFDRRIFYKYEDRLVGYLNDKEWERFIESSYFQHIFQKLL